MANFLKSLFFGEKEEPEEVKKQKNFDVFKYDGIKALRLRQIAYAIRCFEEALKLQEDFETREYLVKAYMQADEPERAIEALEGLIVLEPDNAALLLLRSNLYFMVENYEPAIADCRRAIEADSGNPQAYFLLAKVQKASKDGLGAALSLSQAIALKEDFAEAYLLRAEVMAEAKDYQEGIEDATRAIDLLPEEENSYLVRGSIYELMNKGELAEKDYRCVIELNPFNEQAYLLLGKFYESHQQWEDALNLWNEVIELKPDFAKAYHERGKIRLAQGDRPGALEDAKKALELDPDGGEGSSVEGTYSNFEEMYAGRVL